MGKETVFVVVRGRLPPGETAQWQFLDKCVQREDVGSFHVDETYRQGAANDAVFQDISYVVDGSMEGVSGGIFAYGVRGKTFFF